MRPLLTLFFCLCWFFDECWWCVLDLFCEAIRVLGWRSVILGSPLQSQGDISEHNRQFDMHTVLMNLASPLYLH